MGFDTVAGPASAAVDSAMLVGPAAGYPRGATVHEIFLRVAAEYPDKPALVSAGRTITYAALATAGRRVATALTDVGVSPGDVVPTLVPRRPELVAVLLGILMRGAVYAALDTRWPSRRKREAVAAVGARLVVAEEPVTGLPHWRPPGDMFDDPAGMFDNPADMFDNPDDRGTGSGAPMAKIAAVDGNSPCCVFLTSGSTGKPKPVLSPHRATARLFAPGAIDGEFGPSRRMPQWAPQPWDAFTLELWSMLLTGGTVVLYDERLPTTGALRSMITDGVDSVWLTSSLFNLIVDEDIDALRGLRQVWIGGERLSVAHVRRFLTHHPHTELVNGYGPVESCVFVTTHRIRMSDCTDPDGIPLGRAVAGTSILVLDGDRLCARDEPGEICVAGDGLAIGYLHDAELTNARFAFVTAGGPPVRVYRTGDRGKVGRDGLLRFLGRVDRQVKVRGFRIELGEVEAHLRALEGVAEAVVLADRDATGSCTGLTGCYLPRGDQVDSTAVRTALAGRIPAHLIPDRLVAVHRIPVTANGKADHAALRALVDRSAQFDGDGPDPATHPADPNHPVDPDHPADPNHPVDPNHPADPILAEVCAIVSSATRTTCGPASRLDDGRLTSLQLIQVCMRVGLRLHASVAPEQVLTAGTVHQLSELVRRTRRAGAEPDRAVAEARIPLADTQVGFLIEHELRPGGRAGHCLIGWVVRGSFEPKAFQAAMADVQRRHEALRADYTPGAEPFLVVGEGRPVSFVGLGRYDRLTEAWADVEAHLVRPLDIGAGEIWRGNHARVGSDQHLVALAIHHIAYDGWSERVLTADLATAYEARRGGRSPEFPGPAPRLADALGARRSDIAGVGSSSAARAYWSGLLTGTPEHRPVRGVVATGPAGVAERARPLPAAVLDGVDRLARRLAVTRFPVLVAAYAGALAETLGQVDFGLGVPVSVRRHASQSDVVTCLVDTVCLRLNASPAAAVEQIVERAREQLSAARQAYGMPFSGVVRAVNPARRQSRNPLFRVMLVYQDNDVRPLSLGSADVRLYRRASPEPMAELVVEIWPDDPSRVVAIFYQDALPALTVEALLDDYLRRLSAIV